MAGSTLARFERRLALVAYFRHVFGVDDVLDPARVRRFYDSFEQLAEGYTPEGRSYVANVLQGDLGRSYYLGRDVTTLIAEALPRTLQLAVVALLFTVLIGVPLGIGNA